MMLRTGVLECFGAELRPARVVFEVVDLDDTLMPRR